jgi:predicted kinase
MVLRLSPLQLPPVPATGPLVWAPWADLPGIPELDDCPQDPEWHAEGDVGIHTRMVLDALLTDPAWATLPPDEQADCWLACLWHDIARPATTRVEDGRVIAPGHSPRGAILARVLGWRAGLPWRRRERIAQLVRHHQVPFFAIEDDHAARRVALLSQVVRLDLLALVNRADARGRVCSDPDALQLNNQLFEALADELGCRTAPYPLPPHHRVLAAQGKRSLQADVFDDTWGEVVVLSGLPGAGKDRWLQGWEGPVVSLDGVRAELGVGPTERQGAVIAAAQERAREHLRRREPFAWNGTNISRELRDKPVGLALRYGARVRIVVAEATLPALRSQNRDRPRPVPESAIERMLRRWQAPTVLEAHALQVVEGA